MYAFCEIMSLWCNISHVQTCTQCQCESKSTQCTSMSVDNPDTIIIAFYLCCDSRHTHNAWNIHWNRSIVCTVVISLFRFMFSLVPRLYGRRKLYGLGTRMTLVQAHVVHYFLMIRCFVIALYARQGMDIILNLYRKLDLVGKGYSPKLCWWFKWQGC